MLICFEKLVNLTSATCLAVTFARLLLHSIDLAFNWIGEKNDTAENVMRFYHSHCWSLKWTEWIFLGV